MLAEQTLCPCGKPLHYNNEAIRRYVEHLIEARGPLIDIELRTGTWRVPRHWIALHGIKAVELPELAARYGWDKIS